MGTQAQLLSRVQALGVASAAITPLLSSTPALLAYIESMLGCRVTLDNTAVAGTIVTRDQRIRLTPTTDATAQLVVGNGGKVTAVTLTAAGIDYTNPPLVEAVPNPTGQGALLKAFLNVAGFADLVGGAGYNAASTISFVGGLPPANSNRASTGCVRQIAIVDSGFGYPAGTTLDFIGGGNPTRKARATGVFDASGRLRSVTLVDMGAGYTAVPKVVPVFNGAIAQPKVPLQVGVGMAEGTPATATLTIVAGVITAVAIATEGNGYVGVPTPVITDPGGAGTGFSVRPRMQVGRVDIVAAGTGYVGGGGSCTITPQFQDFFPTNAEQAKAFVALQTAAYTQACYSPVVAIDPIIT
jgi:hypothetical protein